MKSILHSCTQIIKSFFMYYMHRFGFGLLIGGVGLSSIVGVDFLVYINNLLSEILPSIFITMDFKFDPWKFFSAAFTSYFIAFQLSFIILLGSFILDILRFITKRKLSIVGKTQEHSKKIFLVFYLFGLMPILIHIGKEIMVGEVGWSQGIEVLQVITVSFIMYSIYFFYIFVVVIFPGWLLAITFSVEGWRNGGKEYLENILNYFIKQGTKYQRQSVLDGIVVRILRSIHAKIQNYHKK